MRPAAGTRATCPGIRPWGTLFTLTLIWQRVLSVSNVAPKRGKLCQDRVLVVTPMFGIFRYACARVCALQLAHFPEAIQWRMKADKLQADLDACRRGEDGMWGPLSTSMDGAAAAGEGAENGVERLRRLNMELSSEVRQLQRDKRQLEAQAAGAGAGSSSPSKAQLELEKWREKQRHEEELSALRSEVRDPPCVLPVGGIPGPGSLRPRTCMTWPGPGSMCGTG